MTDNAALAIHFAPLLPGGWLVLAMLAAGALCLVSILFFRRGLAGRALVALAFILILLNPSFLAEQREPMKDTAVVVIDRSASQSFGERTQTTDDAANALSRELAAFKNLDVRTIEAGGPNGTNLFTALDQAFSDIPEQRRAGVILLTDGQVQDVPADPEKQKSYGPVHVLLSGERDEFDRQLILREAPSYGIVGKQVTIRYEVLDQGDVPAGDGMADVSIRANGGPAQERHVPVNTVQSETVSITHAGQNVFEIKAAPVDGELTTVNNRAPILVNGVRDRLKVLLISGKPYPGERTWRDLLTSDPGVDLVHFTILRQPDKVDFTPQDEMSLIAFPFRELFEVKLYDFDLIIFDQYSLSHILPVHYFDNIASYVRKGGALLVACGPDFEGPDSIYSTSLKTILPAAPTGGVMQTLFKPEITALGERHPVTQGLHWGDNPKNPQNWGPWLRQIGIAPKTGDVVMSGARGEPLLVLSHVGKGRVAQLASDEIWLWSRGYKGGGPQAELLRRLAHWLMKEPALEENALEIMPAQGGLTVRRRSLHARQADVTLRFPDGTEKKLALQPGDDGWLEEQVSTAAPGIYSASDGKKTAFAIIGQINPPEWQSVITTGKRLRPVVETSGGSIHWLSEEGTPDVRRVGPGMRHYGGYGWVGLRDNHAYAVTGVRDIPLLSALAGLILLLMLAIGAWWFEGRQSQA